MVEGVAPATHLARWNRGVYDCQKGKASTAYSKLPRSRPEPTFGVSTLPAWTPAMMNLKPLRSWVNPLPPWTSSPNSSGLTVSRTGLVTLGAACAWAMPESPGAEYPSEMNRARTPMEQLALFWKL